MLDVGCGNGRYLQEMNSMHAGIKHMIGVDPTMVLVAAGRKILPEATFCYGSAADLSFIPNATADVYVSVFPNAHMDDKELLTSMQEAVRVTKTGGMIFHGVSNAYPPPWGSQHAHPKEWWQAVGKKLIILPPFFKDSHAARDSPWSNSTSRFDVYFTNLPPAMQGCPPWWTWDGAARAQPLAPEIEQQMQHMMQQPPLGHVQMEIPIGTPLHSVRQLQR